MDALDHWETLFDHTYLRWFDLRNEPALCEIVKVEPRVEMTLPGGAKARKPVIHMKLVRGKIADMKPLVLNATNGSSIAAIHGNQPSKWPGKQIVLFETQTSMWNKETKKMDKVPCIRIREARTK